MILNGKRFGQFHQDTPEHCSEELYFPLGVVSEELSVMEFHGQSPPLGELPRKNFPIKVQFVFKSLHKQRLNCYNRVLFGLSKPSR
jgi:hypothetical protein